MKRKVITRLCGGLGNQLFIYAAARRLALVNNADLVLDNISGFRHDPIYKRTFQLDKFAFLEGQYATPKELMQPFSRARFWLSRYSENKKIFLRENISKKSHLTLTKNY